MLEELQANWREKKEHLAGLNTQIPSLFLSLLLACSSLHGDVVMNSDEGVYSLQSAVSQSTLKKKWHFSAIFFFSPLDPDLFVFILKHLKIVRCKTLAELQTWHLIPPPRRPASSTQLSAEQSRRKSEPSSEYMRIRVSECVLILSVLYHIQVRERQGSGTLSLVPE